MRCIAFGGSGWRILMMALVVRFGAACESSDVEMRLLVYDRALDTYALEDVTVKTLDSISKLDGDATVVRGGLSIVLDYQAGSLEWNDEGNRIAFGAVRENGVLVPDSFDSLAMATVYYSMELSYLFYKDTLALAEQMPPRLPTYYSPRVETIHPNGDRVVERDNAFYMKIDDDERAFFVVPFEQFQWIPMALNSGIITHEYTHYIFDILVNDKILTMDNASENFLRSLNEGSADYMAVVRTEDPLYMSHTIPSGLFVTPECNASKDMELTRNIANPETRNYNAVMDVLARSTVPNDYCPYEIGLVVAALLYEIAGSIDSVNTGEPPTHKTLIRVGKWWINALEQLGQQLASQRSFELWEAFGILIDEILIDTEKELACDIIRTRYRLYFSEVDGC